MAWIYVCCLECGKQQLTWGSIVAVAAGEQDGDRMIFEELQHLATLVVACIIQQQVMAAAPARPVRVQFYDQVLEEEHHRAAVRV